MKSKICYFTFNEPYSGIYSSQVIEVIKFLNNHFEKEIKLIAFISVRKYFENKKKIKAEFASSIVLPMFPKITNWKKNAFLLRIICKYYSVDTIIGRSVLATQIALLLKQKKHLSRVIYDGRGAIAAEWKEYNVVENNFLVQRIQNWEQNVVLNADYRIGVSNQLIAYWSEKYAYNKSQHAIIPCTISSVFENLHLTNRKMEKTKNEFNFSASDVVFIYSGSLAGWQSLPYTTKFLHHILSVSANNKILFLSDSNKEIIALKKLFLNQVFVKKVAPIEVPKYLMLGDYGILLREQSVTNQVASPVKFAEYLACGLKVIISKNLGDYTNLIHENTALGCVYTDEEISFEPVSFEEKSYIREMGLKKFSKINFQKEYAEIF